MEIQISDQVKDLWLKCFTADLPSDADEFLRTVFRPENMLSVTMAGRLVSMLHIIPFGPKAFIYAVATHPEFRGRGFAGRLIEEAIEKCRKQGFESIVLIPETEQLREWYKGFGFEGRYPVIFEDCEYDFGTGDKSRDFASILKLKEGTSGTETVIILSKGK